MDVIVALWIMCGAVSALIASSKGGSGLVGFVLGFLFGPFGILFSLFMGSPQGKVEKQVATGHLKTCPRCAEAVLPAALVCKHCGHEFSANAGSELKTG